MAITYITNGKSKEFSLPDGHSADYIAITPPNAKGKVTLCRGIDYVVVHGVVRLLREIPEGSSLTISNNIDDLITADTSEAVENNTVKINELLVVNKDMSKASASLEYLSEASLNNSASIATLFSKLRETLESYDQRISALQETLDTFFNGGA